MEKEKLQEATLAAINRSNKLGLSLAKLGAASASSETSNTLDSLCLGHQIDLNTRPLIGSGFWPLVVMLRYLANITN